MYSKSLKYLTESDNETVELGRKTGALLRAGDLVALVGQLGSGKTWFAKGLALGLGVDPDMVVTSPSFSLVNEYDGRYKLYHMDLYRLSGLPDLINSGLEEYIYCEGVVIIEWADRWPEILPEQKITVEIMIIDDRHREITLSGDSYRAQSIIGLFEKDIYQE